MVIVDDKNIENTVFFPKNLLKSYEIYQLVLNDRGSNKKYFFSELEDTLEGGSFQYTFELDLSDIDNGEYEYELWSMKYEDVITPVGPHLGAKGMYIDTNGESKEGEPNNVIIVFETPYNPEYKYYVTANYLDERNLNPEVYVANYFDRSGRFISGEYLQTEVLFENQPLSVPDGCSLTILNGIFFQESFVPFNIDRVTVEPRQVEKAGKGIIRVNSLNLNYDEYKNNDTYLVYDKQ